MYRGTTPTLIFRLINPNLDLDDVVECWVTIKGFQHNRTWVKDEVTFDNEHKTVTVPLTQEDTLGFSEGLVKAQIRFLLDNGGALATTIVETNINEILKNGVITNE